MLQIHTVVPAVRPYRTYSRRDTALLGFDMEIINLHLKQQHMWTQAYAEFMAFSVKTFALVNWEKQVLTSPVRMMRSLLLGPYRAFIPN